MKKNLLSAATLAFITLAVLPGCKKDAGLKPQNFTNPHDVIGSDTTVLVDAPTNNPAEVTLGYLSGQGDYTNPASPEETMAEWTIDGAPVTMRQLVKFDLSTIPASATVVKALLFLYSDPHPQNGNLQTANFGCDGFYVWQADSAWSAKTVNWFNQPGASTANHVSLSDTPLPFQDLQLDVTGIVQSMVQSGNNYGFKMQLRDETMLYTSRIFVSSFSPDATRHPKLVVTYVNSPLLGVAKGAKLGRP